MSDPFHCPGVRDAALITIDTLVPLKHDRCAVAADFFAQDGIGNQAAGIGKVPCRNEPLCPKAELRDGNDPRGRVFLVDPQTDVGRPLSAAQPIPGHDIIREAMHIQQQKARMLNACTVQLLMMPMIPDQRLPAQFGRNRLDPCPVIGPLVAETHPEPLHRLLRARKTLHIAEQAADREIQGVPAVSPCSGHHLQYSCVPHPFMIGQKLFFGDADGFHEFFRERCSIMGHME